MKKKTIHHKKKCPLCKINECDARSKKCAECQCKNTAKRLSQNWYRKKQLNQPKTEKEQKK